MDVEQIIFFVIFIVFWIISSLIKRIGAGKHAGDESGGSGGVDLLNELLGGESNLEEFLEKKRKTVRTARTARTEQREEAQKPYPGRQTRPGQGQRDYLSGRRPAAGRSVPTPRKDLRFTPPDAVAPEFEFVAPAGLDFAAPAELEFEFAEPGRGKKMKTPEAEPKMRRRLTRSRLRDAVILSEVLAKPLALRNE